ncbi:MAG TPA: hypothetical protein VGB84_07495, partial [Arachidicoccus sp.]
LLMAIFGMMPLGSLVVGAISERIGAPNTILFQGIIGIIVALVFVRILKKKNQPMRYLLQENQEAEEQILDTI